MRTLSRVAGQSAAAPRTSRLPRDTRRLFPPIALTLFQHHNIIAGLNARAGDPPPSEGLLATKVYAPSS